MHKIFDYLFFFLKERLIIREHTLYGGLFALYNLLSCVCSVLYKQTLQMRVIRAFQSTTLSSHPTSLTTSTAERLRASYRRLQLAREREEQISACS